MRLDVARRMEHLAHATATMNVVFASSTASFVASYPTLLLLRDNIQHHLQCGRPVPGYALIHRIAEPPLRRSQKTLARQLWNEISLGFRGLAELRLEQLAISIRTRALLSGVRDLPPVRGTTLASVAGWSVPIPMEGKSTLAEIFSELRDGLACVTRFGTESGHIEVVTPRCLIR